MAGKLTDGIYIMTPSADIVNGCYVFMEGGDERDVRGVKGLPGKSGQFHISEVSDGVYKIVLMETDLYWYMDSDIIANVHGVSGDKGPQSHFLISSTGKGSYCIRSEKWPDWYVYMEADIIKHEVRGWKGDPGPQGYFIMEKIN